MVQITLHNPANNIETLQVINDIIRLISEDCFILTAWRHIAENGMIEYALEKKVLIITNKNTINIYEIKEGERAHFATIKEE